MDILGFSANLPIYITELNVPQTEGIHNHITDIDLISFYPINKTIQILEEVIRMPLGLTPFSHPHMKCQIEHRYWSSHSITKRNTPEGTKLTDIKLRKRIHGHGSSLSLKEIENLKRLGFGHIISSFYE